MTTGIFGPFNIPIPFRVLVNLVNHSGPYLTTCASWSCHRSVVVCGQRESSRVLRSGAVDRRRVSAILNDRIEKRLKLPVSIVFEVS